MRFTLSLLALAVTMLASAPADASAQKKSRDKLTRAEIDSSAFRDQELMVAIRALKPHFLQRPRGVRTIQGGMPNPLVVYVDGLKASGTDALFAIRAQDVLEVKYLEPSKSQNEYGIIANGGALQVKLIQSTVTERTP